MFKAGCDEQSVTARPLNIGLDKLWDEKMEIRIDQR